MSVKPILIELRELEDGFDGFKLRKAHVFCPVGRKYYHISENKTLEETLVFNSNPQGEIANHYEVFGGRFMTIEEVLTAWDINLFMEPPKPDGST